MQDLQKSTAPTAEVIPFPRSPALPLAGDDQPLEQALNAARLACLHLGNKIEAVILELERSVANLSIALESNPAASAENARKLSEIKGQLAVARFMIATLPQLPPQGRV